MKEITKIHPLSVAKMGSLLFVIIGSIVGILSYSSYAVLFTVFQTANGLSRQPSLQPPVSPEQLNWGVIGILLVTYSLAGFFVGYVGAFVYNILAPRIGGIEVKLQEKSSQL